MVDVGHPKQTRAAFVANLVKERLDAFHATGRLTPLWLGVWGYDEDPRALFEIPEVRDWCAELYQEIQGLFAFLHPDTISWLFPCLAEVEILAVHEKRPEGPLKELLDRISSDQKEELRQKHPGSFLQTSIRFLPGTDEIIEQVQNRTLGLLEKISTSQQELDRLVKEFETRFNQGLRMMGWSS